MKSNPVALTRFIMFVLFAAVLVYFGSALYTSLNDDIRTQIAYQTTKEDAIEVTGFLVREEVTLSAASGGVVDVLLTEGEKTGRYQVIANVYQNANGPELTRQISQLEQELEQLEDTRSRSIDTGDTLKLGDSIVSALVTLRSSVAQGDLTGLENQTSQLKSLIFKRTYTYEGTDYTLDETISDIAKQLDSFRAEYARNTTKITADLPGIYSGLVDGYEGILSPMVLESLTPSALDDLVRHPPNVVDNAVGKLITSSTWYYAFSCATEEAARFTPGRQLTVRFSRDISQEFTMTVSHIGEEENGRAVVSLSCDRHLAETTLLRQQTVEIIFNVDHGLYVPKSAVRIDAEGKPGIFTIVGIQAEYKPVVIVAEGDDYFLVVAADTGRKSLRQGEEVIVSGVDLFDGKVVR